VKTWFRTAVGWLWLGPLAAAAPAAFTSLYIFGDGVCTTTNGPGGPYYYGNRFTNGRVWVEVLAQRLGLIYHPDRNWSYFGHDSTNLLRNVSGFPAPADAASALFVIWCIDADLVWNANNSGTNPVAWTLALDHALTNHLKAVTNLYAKGARTLLMPNAVDITRVPYYVHYAPANRAFIRQRIVEFNARFQSALRDTAAALPGLQVHVPHLFALLDDVLSRPAAYGVTNALDADGYSIDALADPALTNKSLGGPGAHYIFWDNLDPTAKLHALVADTAHQLLSPVRIAAWAAHSGSTRLDVVNMPIGRNGQVEGSVNCAAWASLLEFPSTNATQTLWVPATGPVQFYRLRFPWTWSWP